MRLERERERQVETEWLEKGGGDRTARKTDAGKCQKRQGAFSLCVLFISQLLQRRCRGDVPLCAGEENERKESELLLLFRL